MITCPSCGAENLEGADVCDDCQHSLTDLSFPVPLTAVEEGLLEDQIEILAPKTPLTVSLGTSVGEVLKKMVDQSIGCVIVVDDNGDGDQVRGIFTERDALMRLGANVATYVEEPIESLMIPDPITLNARDKIAFALHKMHVGGYRHIPILSEEKLIGVISIRDILNYLTERIGVST
ncbi:MAG: CBS domain-containing protein [Planctomycetes bacterium]|nr:CBS domain-containing protein [Planctomycetota bacterium]